MIVLLVSDDERLRDSAESGLGNEMHVRMATDSRDALRSIADEKPDVIVVDLQTGSAGGYNLIKELREAAYEIPSLLLLERSQDAWLAKQAGARSVRVKPLDVSQLVDEISAIAGPKSPN